MSDNILDQIIGGQHDNDLDLIISTVQDRKQIIARRVVDELEIGDTVRLKNLRPKYMVGAKATVASGIRQKRLSVTLIDGAGKYPAGAEVTVQPQMVEKVDA